MTPTDTHVYANRSNVGDWLSARGIQSLLRPHATIVELLCDHPFMPATEQAIDALPSGSVVVIGGAGLLMDYFTSLWDLLRRHADRLRVVLWGVGVVDLKRAATLPPCDLVAYVAARATLRVVRDQRSAELLGADCTVNACPSLLTLEPEPLPDEPDLCHAANYTTVGGDIYDRMVAIARDFCDRTGRVDRETNNSIKTNDEHDLVDVLRRYRRADLVLSSRLHGCVIARALGRPVLPVSGDHKVGGFMSAAGLEEWVLGQDQVNAVIGRLAVLRTQAFLAKAAAGNGRIADEVLQVAREVAA